LEKPGPDLVLTGGKLVWEVLAPIGQVPSKWLVGRFAGAGEGTVGASDSAVALCRDAERVACLQPLATGDLDVDEHNFAFGISAVRLE
jgi:hypothetical protein